MHKLVITHMRFWSSLIGCKLLEGRVWVLFMALLSPQPEHMVGIEQIFVKCVEGQDVSIFLKVLPLSRTMRSETTKKMEIDGKRKRVCVVG